MPAWMARWLVLPKPSTSCGGPGAWSARQLLIPYSPTERDPGCPDHVVFGGSRGEVGHGVKAGRQAGERYPRGVLGERVDEDVAAGGVFGAHAPQVPVVAAGFDQQGQCELVQAR